MAGTITLSVSLNELGFAPISWTTALNKIANARPQFYGTQTVQDSFFQQLPLGEGTPDLVILRSIASSITICNDVGGSQFVTQLDNGQFAIISQPSPTLYGQSSDPFGIVVIISLKLS